MADTKLTFTFASDKVLEYVGDYCYVHPNNEKTEDGVPIYTDIQWVKEHIKRFIKSQIIRGKRKKYEAAGSGFEANGVV